jgi:hypothetical protein
MDVHNRKGSRQNGARLSKALSQIKPISTSQNLRVEVLLFLPSSHAHARIEPHYRVRASAPNLA